MNIDERRRIAVEWSDFATAGDAGRMVDDPVYRAVTEGRDPGPVYSSCADLAHWLLYRLGCREQFINRVEHEGYAQGRNINRLVWKPIGHNPFAERVQVSSHTERRAFFQSLGPGDIVITWSNKGTNAHALVFERFESDLVHSWDLGQGPMSVDAWKVRAHLEAQKRCRSLVYMMPKSVLRLDKVPFFAQPELPSGELLEHLEQGGK